jgi:hypothetical protein
MSGRLTYVDERKNVKEIWTIFGDREVPQLFENETVARWVWERMSAWDRERCAIQALPVRSLACEKPHWLGEPGETLLLQYTGTNGCVAPTWEDGPLWAVGPWEPVEPPENWRELIVLADTNTYGHQPNTTDPTGDPGDWEWYAYQFLNGQGYLTGGGLLAARYVG